jgi:hypothetical protein
MVYDHDHEENYNSDEQHLDLTRERVLVFYLVELIFIRAISAETRNELEIERSYSSRVIRRNVC